MSTRHDIRLTPSCYKFPKARLTSERDPDTELPLYVIDETQHLSIWINGRWFSLCLPRGFKYDGASLPKLVRAVWDTNDAHSFLAASIHDLLYSSKGGARFLPGFLATGVSGGMLTRDECDHVLYHLMRAAGASWFRSYCYLKAVQFGGQAAWNDAN